MIAEFKPPLKFTILSIDALDIGKDRIHVGNGIYMVKVKQGEPEYKEGSIVYIPERHGEKS